MDALAIMTGAIQVIGFCSQCTVSIVKWVGEVQTVDGRIAAFYDEVNTLKGTYDGLNKTLRSPRMSEAARGATTSDGSYLWKQLHTALDDSKTTMIHVNRVLDEISSAHGIGRSIKKQLLESLRAGELSRLHRRIIFFNQNLSFPIQMMTIWLQLDQRDISEEHQKQLDLKLGSLEREMRHLVRTLESSAADSSTLVASASPGFDDPFEIKDPVQFAKKFLATASVAASTRSASSSSPEPSARYTSLPSVLEQSSHNEQRRMRVNDWVVDQIPENQSSSAMTHPTEETSDTSDSDSDEVDNTGFELRRASTHLDLGQEKLEQNDFESAEKCFRKALDLMQKNNFAEKLACQPADVVLMLSDCCMKQDRFDEAIGLLEPISNKRQSIYPGPTGAASLPATEHGTRLKPTRFQSLAASHMIGEAYMLKGEYENAIVHALKAFKRREKNLGERHSKTLESAQLLIKIYQTNGDDEEAEVFKRIVSHTSSTTTVSSTLTSPVNIPEPLSLRALNQLPIRSTPTLPIQPDSTPKIGTPTRMPGHSKTTSGSRWPFARSSSSQMPPPPARNSFSGRSNLNQVHINEDKIDLRQALGSPVSVDSRKYSWPSTISTPERTSINEEAKPGEFPMMERASSSQGLEPVFTAIHQLCAEGKHKMGIKRALGFMKGYKGQAIMLVRENELQENIKKGGDLGLAASGHGYAPIHYFTELRDHECVDEVSLLIRHGVDVNAVAHKAGRPGHNALTPLQYAVGRGYQNITRLLLAVDGIKADVKDLDGFSPIMVACRLEHHNIVAQLLAHGVNPAPQDFPVAWYGNSLLHDAARQCDPTLVRMLLAHSHEIDGKDKFDRTPLIYAVIKQDMTNPDEKKRKVGRRIETIKLLIDDGASKRIRDYRGRTALDHAREEDCPELVTVLESYFGSTKIAELDGRDRR